MPTLPHFPIQATAALTITAVLVISLSACNAPPALRTQQAEQRYQFRVVQIQRPFLRPTAGTDTAVHRLKRAIAQLASLHPPIALKRLHQRLVADLVDELRAFRAAAVAAAGPAPAALGEEVARARSAQRGVSVTLGELAKVIGACQNNAARC